MSIRIQQWEALQFHLRTVAPLAELCRSDRYAHADEESCSLILEQAARFSEEVLAPLAASGDQAGCRLQDGRVRLPPGSAPAWRRWAELGFPALGLPAGFGGLDLPLVVQSAVQEVCDGANLAFGMLPINLRCAALALLRHARPDLAERWLPRLADGTLAATIVISEAQAGSDVGRIRCRAEPAGEEGLWRISGSKLWISYGDHDATGDILHLVLARLPGAAPGTRGLGLFAVPDRLGGGSPDVPRNPDGEATRSRNGVRVLRLEHKMGLHASPTCALEFEDALGWQIGEADQGIRNLFVMMNAMRLAVGVQGAAAANAAALHATAYARTRPQGGPPEAPPVMITAHADVRRMLLEMSAAGELLRALALRTAWYLDMAACGGDGERAARCRSHAELLLPAAKTLGAELGFQTASQGIQVLGGYGYTADYPLERIARDIRVAAIYEGTSGIQARDFLLRKVCRDEGAALHALLEDIAAALAGAAGDNPLRAPLEEAMTLFRARLGRLLTSAPEALEAAAYGFLRFAGLIFCGWCALDLYQGAVREAETGLGGQDYRARLCAALRLYGARFAARARDLDGGAALDPRLLDISFPDD